MGVYIGRKAQRYQGGVPIVPYQRIVHDFPNLEPTHYARKVFRTYSLVTCVLGGIAFAYLTVDQAQMRDSWYDRPDLKPFKAMVPKEEMDITERTAYEAHYNTFRQKMNAQDKKKRAWYRLFFPLDADYRVK